MTKDRDPEREREKQGAILAVLSHEGGREGGRETTIDLRYILAKYHILGAASGHDLVESLFSDCQLMEAAEIQNKKQ